MSILRDCNDVFNLPNFSEQTAADLREPEAVKDSKDVSSKETGGAGVEPKPKAASDVNHGSGVGQQNKITAIDHEKAMET